MGFFSEALRLDATAGLGADDFRRARWERQLGEAYVGLGQMAESREHLERVLALLGRPVPTTRIGLVARLAGQLLRQALHRARRGCWSGRRQPPAAERLEAGYAERWLVEVLFFANELLPTAYLTVRALNEFESAEPSWELAQAYAGACFAAGFVPLHSLAETYGRLALETARSAADPKALGLVLLISAMHQIGVGQWASARAFLEEALDIAARLGDWRQGEQCRSMLAIVAIYRGEFARAAQLGAELRATARRRGDTQMQAVGLHWMVEPTLATDTPDRAVELAEEAAALVGGTADRLEHFITEGLLALARMRRGERSLALQAADEAARLVARSTPMAVWSRDAYAAVAEVYLTHWEAGNREYARQARQACADVRKYARVFPIGEPPARLCGGWAEWLDGRPRRAIRTWQRGLAAAERLAMPFDEARLHYQVGRHLPPHDPAHRQHLERACALFKRIGATYYLARAAEELRRAGESERGHV